MAKARKKIPKPPGRPPKKKRTPIPADPASESPTPPRASKLKIVLAPARPRPKPQQVVVVDDAEPPEHVADDANHDSSNKNLDAEKLAVVDALLSFKKQSSAQHVPDCAQATDQVTIAAKKRDIPISEPYFKNWEADLEEDAVLDDEVARMVGNAAPSKTSAAKRKRTKVIKVESSSENDSSESESDSDDGVADNVEYQFSIPVDECTVKRKFRSDISWKDFRYEVAEAMGISVKDLKLAYRFSTTPQRERPEMLSSEDQIRDMFAAAVQATNIMQQKKKKTKTAEFKIILVDRRSKEAKQSKLKANKHGKSKVRISLSHRQENNAVRI